MLKNNGKHNREKQEIQLSHLLLNVKNLLEVAEQYLHKQQSKPEAVRRIEKALGDIKFHLGQLNKS